MRCLCDYQNPFPCQRARLTGVCKLKSGVNKFLSCGIPVHRGCGIIVFC